MPVAHWMLPLYYQTTTTLIRRYWTLYLDTSSCSRRIPCLPKWWRVLLWRSVATLLHSSKTRMPSTTRDVRHPLPLLIWHTGPCSILRFRWLSATATDKFSDPLALWAHSILLNLLRWNKRWRRNSESCHFSTILHSLQYPPPYRGCRRRGHGRGPWIHLYHLWNGIYFSGFPYSSSNLDTYKRIFRWVLPPSYYHWETQQNM